MKAAGNLSTGDNVKSGMRRALLVLAAVVVAVGGTLIYVGTRGHSRRQVERLPHLATTTSSVLLPEGTWAFGSGPAGFAVGRMYAIGGPKTQGTMPDSPLSGIVELHRHGDKVALEKVTVDATGKFRLDLPVGDYYLVGRPASGSDPLRSEGFSISAGHSTAVDLVEQLT